MNIRILICGIVGGLLGAYALSLPLYLVLPASFTSTWLFSGWEAVTFVGYALSVYIALCTGYVCARWNWASNGPAGMRAGRLAGLLAALVAYALVGAAAAAVVSQEPIFAHGARTAVTSRAAILLVCKCVVQAAWYPSLMFWGMVASGALLAGLGGWFAAYRGAAPWGKTPPAVVDEGCDTSVALMVMASWILIAVIVAISALQTNCEKSVNQYGFELRFSPLGITGWPIANLFLLLVVSTWYSGRWCARRRNHPLPGIQRVAMLVQMLIGFLPVAIVLALLHIRRETLDDPIFAVGLAAWILVLVYWAARSSRGTADFSTADTAPPSFQDRLLLNGGFLGCVVPGLVLVTGVTQAVALALGIVIYLPAIFAPYPPLVGVAAVGLGDNGGLGVIALLAQRTEFHDPLAAAPIFTPDATIQRIYAIHVWGTMTIVVAWILAATLHAGAVTWWQGKRKAKPHVTAKRELPATS